MKSKWQKAFHGYSKALLVSRLSRLCNELQAADKKASALLKEVREKRASLLGRIGVDGRLLERVRDLRSALADTLSSAEAPLDDRIEITSKDSRPRTFTINRQKLAELSEDARAAVASAVAIMADQNMDYAFDLEMAQRAAGDTNEDIFHYVGVEWLELLVRYCLLCPDSHVLDIGCGSGRMARALATWLSRNGSFQGFDPVADSIKSAASDIRKPNFTFEHIDLQHYLYNPHGKIIPTEFRFPCPDASKDVALAASVFTHLDRETAQHYLAEAFRVLKPGGHCLFSLFAMTPEMLSEPDQPGREFGPSGTPFAFRFKNVGEGFYVHCDAQGNPIGNDRKPDKIGDPVAYDLEVFAGMASKAGFEVVSKLLGGWTGRAYHYGYQDLVALRRPVS